MGCEFGATGTGLALLSGVPEEGDMKIRTMVGALVLGAGMLLGGSKTTEAGWVRPVVRERVFVGGFRGPYAYRSFYRPYAFRPYFYGPRFVYRPYYYPRPFYRPYGPVVYYRGW
jgi:hypothetical protein